VYVVFENPKERVVLLEYGKKTSAVDVAGKTARHQHVKTTLSPKKLPGSALLPPAVHAAPMYVSDLADVGNFSSVQYLATDEVFGIIADWSQHFCRCITLFH